MSSGHQLLVSVAMQEKRLSLCQDGASVTDEMTNFDHLMSKPGDQPGGFNRSRQWQICELSK